MPVIPIHNTAESSRVPSIKPRAVYNLITTLLTTTSSRVRSRTPPTDSPVSLPHPKSPQIYPRELYFALPASYKGLNAGPSPGTVVGITLGSVLGFLLLIWLIQSITRGNPGGQRYIQGNTSEVVVTRRSEHSGKRHRSKRTRRTQRSEMSSASSGGPPPPQPRQPSPPPPRRTERIIREEVRVRQESRPPVAMPMPPPMPEETNVRETINININEGGRPERRVDGDDIVEVIEEEQDEVSSPERSRTRRTRGGYRTVDPGEYAGGNYPQREMRNGPRRYE